MGGSSEGDGTSSITSKATSYDPESFKPWIKEKVLGTGGFGTVTLWKNETSGETVALKKCRWGNSGSPASPETLLSPEHRERWQKEVQIMLRLDHPCVVSCFPVPRELEGGPGDLPMLCMEYCSGGDLRRLLNRPENCCGLREVTVRSCLKDLTEAVAYLHSQRIIHRDLKPENIVMQDTDGQTRYKLIDLGYAKELEYTSVCTSFVGTLQYLAPELFLSKRYSCTVDYWSLGLVVHEIITGVRPFLPNMSPVEWMKRVRSKKASHICVYEGRNNEVHFSEHMFDECHISKPFKREVEAWLQLMLEWEPAKRGQVDGAKPDDKKQVVAFTRMAALLSKKIIRVLVVSGCRLLEYEVTSSTSLSEVQEWVQRDAGLLMDEQRLLLPRGHPPDASKPASQCWAPPEEEDWLLYVFSSGTLTPHVAPHFPALVEEMLRAPRALVEHGLQRRMWCHSLYFLHRENKLLSALISAQKVAMLHLLSRHSELTRCGQRVLNDIAKLQARHHLFMEALNTDLDHYTSQAPHARITSEKAYGAWRGGGEVTLSAVHAAVDKTQRLDASLTALNTKVMELHGSPFSAAKTPTDTLDSIVSNCEELYVSLRRRSREERSRSHDSTAMCKLLLQALRKRDRLYQDLYTHIEKQWGCLSEVSALCVPLEELLSDIARAAHTISSLQQHRQDDIWKIMAIVASHSRGGVAGVPSGELPRAPAPPQPLTNLALLLQQSNEQTDSIVAENRALRCQMVELLSNNLASTLVVTEGSRPQPVDQDLPTKDGQPEPAHQHVPKKVSSQQQQHLAPSATKTALLEARRRTAVETAL
ncbi:Protein kinase domain [Trinorchestia longiramus]|nr:Protein kinase domain [Trinorchestia longiramus]